MKKKLTLQEYSVNSYKLLLESALFISIKNCFNNSFDFPEDCNLPSEVYELIDRVKKDLLNLNDTLTENESNRFEILNYYKDAKPLIHSITKSLLLYKQDIELLNEVITDNIISNLYKDDKPLPCDPNNHSAVNLCMYYFDKYNPDSGCGCGDDCGCGHDHSHDDCGCGHDHSHDDTSLLIANIIGSVKSRMTKDKFYDYIKNGLLLSSEDISPDFALFNVEMLIANYFPQAHENYGEYFTSFKTPLKSLMEKDFKNDTRENLTEFLTILKDMYDKITDYIDLAFSLNESCNTMILLFEYAKSFDNVIGDNLVNRDLYFSVKENINLLDEDDDLFHKIDNNLDENIEFSIDELTVNSMGVFETLMKTAPEDLTDSDIEVIEGFEQIRNLYYESIDQLEELFFASYEEIDEEAISKEDFSRLIDEELPEILESTSHLPSSTRKFLKQNVLKYIQSSFTEEDMLMYVKFSYSACTNQNEQQAFLHKLIRNLDISEEDLEELGISDAFQDEYSFESLENLEDRGEI